MTERKKDQDLRTTELHEKTKSPAESGIRTDLERRRDDDLKRTAY